jgi:hypothetical protein
VHLSSTDVRRVKKGCGSYAFAGVAWTAGCRQIGDALLSSGRPRSSDPEPLVAVGTSAIRGCAADQYESARTLRCPVCTPSARGPRSTYEVFRGDVLYVRRRGNLVQGLVIRLHRAPRLLSEFGGADPRTGSAWTRRTTTLASRWIRDVQLSKLWVSADSQISKLWFIRDNKRIGRSECLSSASSNGYAGAPFQIVTRAVQYCARIGNRKVHHSRRF